MRRRFGSPLGILLLALALTLVVFATTPVTESNRGFDFDGVFYGAMAGSPAIVNTYAHVAPWCYRIVTPALVRALPVDTLTGFRIVAFASTVGSLCLVFVIIRRIGFADPWCAVGVLLYASVFWTVKFAFYSPAYIDHQTQMLLLAIIWLTIQGRYAWAAAALAIGAMQKESLAVFALFSAAHLLRTQGERVVRFDRSALASAALLVAAPLSAIVIVRRTVVAVDEYSALRAMLAELPRVFERGFWPVFAQSIFSGLGLLAVIAAVSPSKWTGWLRDQQEWAVYAVLCAALIFGGVDKARLLLYAVPLVLVLALWVIRSMAGRLPPTAFAAWLAVALGIHLWIGGLLGSLGTYSDYLARFVPEHAAGRFMPHLVLNATAAAGFAVLTLVLLRSQGARR